VRARRAKPLRPSRTRNCGNSFGLDPAALKEVAADEEKRQERTDWSFMFIDPASMSGRAAGSSAMS